MLGAGDAAVAAVARAYTAAASRREAVQYRVAELPAENAAGKPASVRAARRPAAD